MPQTGPVTIDSPASLAPDTLFFRTMDGGEALSQCFEYRVTVSSSAELNAADVLGVPTTLHLQTTDGGIRHFNGVIASLDFLGTDETVNYRMVLRPWLWLLTRSANCRVFQNQNAVDIVASVFRDLHFSDFDTSSLLEDYSPREYVVQYRETDFDFVSRLMEREGIYYYFRHDSGKHTLVLADSCTNHDFPPAGGGAAGLALPLRPPDANRLALQEFVDAWRVRNEVRPGVYSHTDFDFTKSRANLFATRSKLPGNAHDGFEVYDYPGGFQSGDDGGAIALVRLEEDQVLLEEAKAWSNGRKLATGNLFSLTDSPRADQNRNYLVASATYRLRGHGDAPGDDGAGEPFTCAFTAIPSTVQFRPPSSTRRPFARGPQTAIVVGPSGEEIWTDNYGRVKIQFHWDREGKNDENSSCFVRVSQAWAGSQFGSIHIPRIGQEVIVDFLEGDPERPIVTGRVYNDANMPPYELPANQTQSGIKSRSTKGAHAANANEIRFEDKKGHEELYLQAERNQTTLVKANQSISVGADRAVSVGANETISVGATRTTTVTALEKQTFKDAREMSVAKTETVTVEQKHTGTYDGGREVTVKGADEILTVNGVNMVTTVHGEYNVTADKQLWVTQNADSLLMKDRFELTSAGPITLANDQCQVELKSGKITLTAATEIALVCGQASVTLKKDGTIEIAGATKVALTGGQGSMELAAAGATLSGPKVSISGSGSTEITGAIVKIN